MENESRKPVFILLAGPSACGKTTVAVELEDEHGFTRVSSDDIRREMFGDVYNRTENAKVFKEAHRRSREALSEGKDVVFDATNCLSANRYRALKNSIPEGTDVLKICAVYTETSPKTILLRNAERSKPVPERIVLRMHKSLNDATPQLYEGYDMIVDLEKLIEVIGLSRYLNAELGSDGGLITDVLAPVCVDEKERRAFERGKVHERFAQQIFKEATS